MRKTGSEGREEEAKTFVLEGSLLSEKLSWPKGQYPLHYHDHYELELVLNGSGSEVFDGQEFLLSRGSLALLRPLDSHAYRSEGISIQHIKVKEEVLPAWIRERIHALPNPIVLSLKEEDISLFSSLMDLAEKELKGKQPHYLENAYLLSELLFTYYFRNLGEGEEQGENLASEVMHYLQEGKRYATKVSLDEIASALGYSKFYVSSSFHRLTGMTIQDYIASLRIERAKKMLYEGDESMEEVASSCGFSSSSSFFTQFKKRVGNSPLQFRKEARQRSR